MKQQKITPVFVPTQMYRLEDVRRTLQVSRQTCWRLLTKYEVPEASLGGRIKRFSGGDLNVMVEKMAVATLREENQ